MKNAKADDILEGTTRRVFRFVYRQRRPVGVHDVQRALGLSSPSVAYYHIGKLLKAGLLKEEGDGYTVDKVVFENMVRIRKTVLPFQMAYTIFFLTALVLFLTVIRPSQPSSDYFFAVVVIAAAFGVTLFEAYKATRTPY